MITAHLSNNGQIIIPKNVYLAHGWKPGTELAVIDVEEGILLRPIKSSARTKMEDTLGCTGYKGTKKSIKDMEKAIARGAKRSK